MFDQRYLQNCSLLLLAVYLIKAVVDPLRVFSTNYYISSQNGVHPIHYLAVVLTKPESRRGS